MLALTFGWEIAEGIVGPENIKIIPLIKMNSGLSGRLNCWRESPLLTLTYLFKLAKSGIYICYLLKSILHIQFC